MFLIIKLTHTQTKFYKTIRLGGWDVLCKEWGRAIKENSKPRLPVEVFIGAFLVCFIVTEVGILMIIFPSPMHF